MITYNVIGLMSGTSLDGVDIAACEFNLEKKKWSYKIHFCRTVPYTRLWKDRLANLQHSNALEFSTTNTEYGHYLGKLTADFIRDTKYHPDFIASHGHTIFHQPEHGLTVQIGSGSAIAAETEVPVVCDFRSLDVALKGQGAPLVPMGDKILFAEYDYCLNLGGFANISFNYKGKRIAYDICPANIVLNLLAEQMGLHYDPEGQNARLGNPDLLLRNRMDNLPFYQKSYPKSLAREWLENEFIPLFKFGSSSINDLLATTCDHIAFQVNRSIEKAFPANILVTGGGAQNTFLMERIREMGKHVFISPSKQIIDFKEALIFAFLGVLRWRHENNVMKSVTGSLRNHSGGTVYLI